MSAARHGVRTSCAPARRLGSSDRWLDIGAGQGQAILDYYALENDAAPAQKCGRSAARAVVVALSIEDRRTDKWQKQAAISGDRLRYLTGKRLRQYSAEELGKFQIITDVYGGFSYTEDLSGFLERVLTLLETGSVFYSLMPGVRLEDGKDKLLGTWYLTELENAIGRPEKVCSWLKKTACVQVTCESKSDWERPTELINIRKVCSNVSVTPMKLLEYNAGTPPTRRFQLNQ
jgi:SAM-dependent methyltransferase